MKTFKTKRLLLARLPAVAAAVVGSGEVSAATVTVMSRTRTFFTFAALACLLAAPSALAGATAQTRAAPSTFPLGTFETIITAHDVARAGFPARNAHYETLTFGRNGTWRDVWFHPRRADQE